MAFGVVAFGAALSAVSRLTVYRLNFGVGFFQWMVHSRLYPIHNLLPSALVNRCPTRATASSSWFFTSLQTKPTTPSDRLVLNYRKVVWCCQTLIPRQFKRCCSKSRNTTSKKLWKWSPTGCAVRSKWWLWLEAITATRPWRSKTNSGRTVVSVIRTWCCAKAKAFSVGCWAAWRRLRFSVEL